MTELPGSAKRKKIGGEKTKLEVKEIELSASVASILIDTVFERNYPISIRRKSNKTNCEKSKTKVILSYELKDECIIEDVLDSIIDKE